MWWLSPCTTPQLWRITSAEPARRKPAAARPAPPSPRRHPLPLAEPPPRHHLSLEGAALAWGFSVTPGEFAGDTCCCYKSRVPESNSTDCCCWFASTVGAPTVDVGVASTVGGLSLEEKSVLYSWWAVFRSTVRGLSLDVRGAGGTCRDSQPCRCPQPLWVVREVGTTF